MNQTTVCIRHLDAARGRRTTAAHLVCPVVNPVIKGTTTPLKKKKGTNDICVRGLMSHLLKESQSIHVGPLPTDTPIALFVRLLSKISRDCVLTLARVDSVGGRVIHHWTDALACTPD